MQVLLAVIDDLFQFAVSPFRGAKTLHIPEISISTKVAPAIKHSTSLSVERLQSPTIYIPRTVEETQLHSGSQYFVGDIDVSLSKDPVISYDNTICMIRYGEGVLLRKLQGRWAQVVYNNREGWILKDALRESVEAVYPLLKEGVCYEHDNPETIKLRACIDDQFGGARAELALSSGEYVSYMLFRKKRTILWPETRPRIAGTWHTILRGIYGVHMSVTPKTGSVMEYTSEEEEGHVAYVDAVFPDGSIRASEVGGRAEGEYTEQVYPQEAWIELKPVFIEVV